MHNGVCMYVCMYVCNLLLPSFTTAVRNDNLYERQKKGKLSDKTLILNDKTLRAIRAIALTITITKR